jgi:CHAT domain-containing protein
MRAKLSWGLAIFFVILGGISGLLRKTEIVLASVNLQSDSVTPISCDISAALSAPKLNTSPPIIEEIIKPDIHWYRIELTQRQFAQVIITQIDANITATLCDSHGQQLTLSYLSQGTSRLLPVSVIADTPNTYYIGITPSHLESKAKYQIAIDELKAASSIDYSRVSAERAFMAANLKRDGSFADRRMALDGYLRTLNLYEQVQKDGDKKLQTEGLLGEVYTREFIVNCLRRLYRYKEALEYAEPLPSTWESLRKLQPERSDELRSGEAGDLDRLAVLERDMTNYEEAVKNEQKSINLWPPAYILSKADSYNNLGKIYSEMGQDSKAQDSYRETLKIIKLIRKAPEQEWRPIEGFLPYREGRALRGIGDIRFHVHDYKSALVYWNKALKAVGPNDFRQQSFTQGSIVSILIESRRLQKAEETIRAEQETCQKSKDDFCPIYIQNDSGKLEYKRKRFEKAIDHFRSGLEMLDQFKTAEDIEPDGPLKQGLLFNLAKAQKAAKQPLEALKTIEQATKMVESTSRNFLDEDYREIYFASGPIYDFQTSLLAEIAIQQQDEQYALKALESSEHSRARNLASFLAQTAVNLQPRVSQALLDKMHASQDRLENAISQWKQTLRSGTEAKRQRAIAELRDAKLTFADVMKEIQTNDPEYANVTNPLSLNIHHLQEQLIDDDTVALEYFLGAPKSFVWAITKNDILVKAISRQSLIEHHVSAFRRAITARTCIKRNETVEEFEADIKKADIEYQSIASELSKELLQPVARYIGRANIKNIAIIPDGALHLLPFSVLPDPLALRRKHTIVLSAGHTIVSLPSLITTYESHRIHASATPIKGIVLIGNPSIANKPSGKQFAQKPVPSRDADALRKIMASMRGPACQKPKEEFSDLRGAAQEISIVRKLAELAQYAIDVADGPKATLAAVLTTNVENYQILHFATHAYIPPDAPEKTGIVLVRTSDKWGRQPAYLRLTDIYNLRLNADIVVLSACDTGVGRRFRGEGTMSLGRAFMYAGSPRVVATLWPIDDTATAQFMHYFYAALLYKHFTASQALCYAQANMRSQKIKPEWQSAFYWGAFTLTGDWR